MATLLTTCPSCGSSFLQPMRCETRSEDDVLVELRCSDCATWLQLALNRSDMDLLDRRQAEWRDAIVAEYERSVAESMEALAASLAAALALDLVGPDDFAPRRFRRAA